MNKFAFLLMSLALVSPVQAEEQTTIRTSKPLVTVRVNYVYQFAQGTCPKWIDVSRQRDSDTGAKFISHVADLAHMTAEERTLLFQMCDMYWMGQIEGVASSKG
jgi:hypothetical protein